MKTIIAGSRDITDYALVECAAKAAPWDITEVVSGGARGVDRLGERVAREYGLPWRQFIPKWETDGRRAGIARNVEMVHYADALIAVWDGKSPGTRHVIDYARKLGLPVLVIRTDEGCGDEPRRVFVFGSNREGRHGKGAALAARQQHGAVYGQAEGLQGNAYAIVTKELRSDYPKVTLEEVAEGVARFLDFAREHSEWAFDVAAIGCGLAGFECSEIAPLFAGAPNNVHLPPEFQ